MVRRTRNEPEGPRIILWPVALILWVFISTRLAVGECLKHGRLTKEKTGLGRPRQLGQMLKLAWFRNVCPLDYYAYQFFDKTYRDQAEFYIPAVRLGRLSLQLGRGMNTDFLDHKLQGYHSLKEAGLPTVDIVEIFLTDGNRHFGRTDAELEAFKGMDFFVKPLNSYGGDRVARWLYDQESDTYSDGEHSLTLAALWEHLSAEAVEYGKDHPDKQARLVQPLLKNHPDLMPFSRRSINSLRVVSMSFPDGHIGLFSSGIRMGRGDSIDDTSMGIAGPINIEKGLILSGFTLHPFEFYVTHHPTTGASLENVQIPYWEEVLALAERAHRSFPQVPLVGWDIAVTPSGPVLVEVNCNPRLDTPQIYFKCPLPDGMFGELYWSWVDPD